MDEKEIDALVDGLVAVYTKIETELMIKIIELLSKNDYNKLEGSLEWYVRKLAEMGTMNNDMVKIIAKGSKTSESKLKKMLSDAQVGTVNMDDLNRAYDRKLIKIDPKSLMDMASFKSLLKTSYIDANGILRGIQTKALEGSKKAYIDILNQAYIGVSSGAIDYNTAIQKAIKKLANGGIKVIKYKNGAEYGIESTVRREVLTAVNKIQNKTAELECDELDAEFVETSAHYGARVTKFKNYTNHAYWQGKVFHRGGEIDYKGIHYKDFETETGYGDIQGLGGVNCRHRFFPFFPDFSIPKQVQYDYDKNKAVFEAEQHQRKLEREMRALKKEREMLKKAMMPTTQINSDIKKKSAEIDKWCKAHNLTRMFERERVLEQITK